jgi:DNA-binding GntR family transcriptional regulator
MNPHCQRSRKVSYPLDVPELRADAPYHQIRRWIVEGRFRPSERLVEQRLAEELGVSRTPVREALRLLQSEGLVELSANRGAAVRSLTLHDLHDHYEIRARLEGMIGEFAAQRATSDQLRRLREANQAFTEAVELVLGGEETAREDVFRLNDLFHLTLLESAHSERLVQCLVRTVDHSLVFQAFRHYDFAALRRSAESHSQIITAVETHDAALAERLMYAHIMGGRDTLIAVVGEDPKLRNLYTSRPGS